VVLPKSDLAFTAPGALIVMATGILMAFDYGDEFWQIKWIQWGLILFGISGMLWIALLIPIQVRQARLARSFQDGGEIPDEFWRLGRQWMLFGIPSTILPFINLYFMVFKPL